MNHRQCNDSMANEIFLHGGFTWIPENGFIREPLKNGPRYVVGIGNIAKLNNSYTLSLKEARKVIKSAIQGNYGIGGWLDNETGIVYYDKIAVEKSLLTAKIRARGYGEIAIFDLYEKIEIRL